ncbi:hypothetical protein V5E38_06035 [Rossellomorea sp. GAMAL-10_SWC]
MKIVKRVTFIVVSILGSINLLFASSFAFLNLIKINVKKPTSPLVSWNKGCELGG